MTAQLTRYEVYAGRVRRMLLIAGLWPENLSSILLRYVVFAHILTSICTSSAILNFVLSHITNVDLVTKGLGLVVGFYTTILKISIFLINRSDHEELHETLEQNFRNDLADPELEPILLSPLEFFYRPTIWLSVSTWAIFSIYTITPPLSVIIQLAHGVSSVKYHLPFPTQYPWNVTGNTFYYSAQYFVEVSGGVAIAGVTAATDALLGFYIFQMTGQLRTISHYMRKLRATDDYTFVMKKCATRYRSLMRCRDILQGIYGPIVLWMLATSSMTICANIYQASQTSGTKNVVVFVYIVMKLMQTLLYGWYGLFLTTESESFRDSVYCSGWPGSGEKSFMSNLRIMLMYKPLVLSACHFSVVSLDMFLAITHTALSYFFLLRTLEEGK